MNFVYIIVVLMNQKWFDILDEEGVWRVGQCLFQDQKGMKSIVLDGFHSNYTALFCQHSDKIAPIRTHTMGLTVPEGKKPLREVLSALQIQNIAGRLNLFLLKPNFLEFEPQLIRSSIRTEFLILVDKIVSTPFEIIREIKMLDLQINKVFINLLNIYTRVLDFSKVFLTMQNTGNQVAQELYKSIYQLTIIVNLILGIHPHSKILYDHKLNINLKPAGLSDYLIVSEGINPFRTFVKNSTIYLKNKKQSTMLDLKISLQIIELCLQICEKNPSQLIEGQNKARTSVLVDDIIAHLKMLGELNSEIYIKLGKNLNLIAKIEALFLKFKPNKQCSLRKYLTPKEQPAVTAALTDPKIKVEQIDDQTKNKVNELQLKIKKMQKLIMDQTMPKQKIYDPSEKIKLPSSIYQKDSSPYQNFPTQNLGQQLFLSSVQWALECGQAETAKKLVKWRKSLLQVGKITGWQTALLVGCKTFKKGQITTEDIIQANYQMLLKNSQN